jgi:hypothetical protein
VVHNLHNDGELALVLSIVDEGETADLDELCEYL